MASWPFLLPGLVIMLLQVRTTAGAESAASKAEIARRPIDRHALVTRHNVVLTNADPFSTLQVGNGEFAVAVDITGLQTFPDHYREGIQLGTQSQWAWASAENPQRFTTDDVLSPYVSRGREVVYADGLGKLKNSGNPRRAKEANAWLRENPHRLQMGRLGLVLQSTNGTPARLMELRNARQILDLWSGVIESHFEYYGAPVKVQTVAHPDRDLVAVRIESSLIKDGRLGVEFEPGESSSNYFSKLTCPPPAVAQFANGHQRVSATNSAAIEVSLAFSRHEFGATELPGFESTRRASVEHWASFWSRGGAVDLSASKDPRWRELERRIVLSQYLTAIQCAGSMPPQETGLVQNSWYGKFHLEMHWWHAAHFALWGRPELLERSMGWYQRILPAARALASRNGYAGARWPKMVGPDGIDSPSPVGGFLIWQQPHTIYLAELLWRANRSQAALEKHREMVTATAEFMASYASWDESGREYVLGPPLIPAQESYGSMRAAVINPTFELAYWNWGLQKAQEWRERMGLKREPRWDDICRKLARPRMSDGRYEAIAVEPYTIKRDHPSMLQAHGFLPSTPLIYPKVVSRTFEFVLKEWDWGSTWGWDYPVLAMTAARLGRGEEAINALLMETPKNRFLPNGHNYQRPNLPLYLPGNGGLLAALAIMTAGWDGAPENASHIFTNASGWSIRWEGLQPMP